MYKVKKLVTTWNLLTQALNLNQAKQVLNTKSGIFRVGKKTNFKNPQTEWQSYDKDHEWAKKKSLCKRKWLVYKVRDMIY